MTLKAKDKMYVYKLNLRTIKRIKWYVKFSGES